MISRIPCQCTLRIADDGRKGQGRRSQASLYCKNMLLEKVGQILGVPRAFFQNGNRKAEIRKIELKVDNIYREGDEFGSL